MIKTMDYNQEKRKKKRKEKRKAMVMDLKRKLGRKGYKSIKEWAVLNGFNPQNVYNAIMRFYVFNSVPKGKISINIMYYLKKITDRGRP